MPDRLWAKGHVHARLGELRPAAAQPDRAASRLLKGGLTREALASSLDGAQLRCRPGKLRGDNLHAARRLLARCADTRRDLSADQRKTLEELENVIENYPENAFAVLGAYRRSFVAPVPGQLGERIAGDDPYGH